MCVGDERWWSVKHCRCPQGTPLYEITPRVLRHFRPPRLNRYSLLQLFFHACPTLSRRFLGCARAAPVGLQTHCEMIAVAFQRLKLPDPINDAPAHRRPFIALTVGLLYRILAMTVANAILWQEIVSIRIGLLITLRCISRIPVEH